MFPYESREVSIRFKTVVLFDDEDFNGSGDILKKPKAGLSHTLNIRRHAQRMDLDFSTCIFLLRADRSAMQTLAVVEKSYDLDT
jgi:hypothetical protein